TTLDFFPGRSFPCAFPPCFYPSHVHVLALFDCYRRRCPPPPFFSSSKLSAHGASLEATMGQALDHPNIVKTLLYVESSSTPPPAAAATSCAAGAAPLGIAATMKVATAASIPTDAGPESPPTAATSFQPTYHAVNGLGGREVGGGSVPPPAVGSLAELAELSLTQPAPSMFPVDRFAGFRTLMRDGSVRDSNMYGIGDGSTGPNFFML
ncbi:hypothetical protein Vafri_15733, partial [Volvox africanus]